MTPEVFDDASFSTTHNGRISPGCPTADAVLSGWSERQKLQDPAPSHSHRSDFAPITPTHNQLTSLQAGSFVLFQLDNRELAARLDIPEDSESFKHCLEFLPKKYLGLVQGSFGGESNLDVEPYEIAFVGRSLPPGAGSGPSKGGGSFVIPIAPTEPGNENNRTPLHPERFPWVGCYQYTIFGARITPTHINPSVIPYQLNDEELLDFEQNCATDHHTALSTRSSSSEASLFDNMIVSTDSILLPVKVWQDLRAEMAEEVCLEPREFVKEVLYFQSFADEE